MPQALGRTPSLAGIVAPNLGAPFLRPQEDVVAIPIDGELMVARLESLVSQSRNQRVHSVFAITARHTN